MLKKKQYNHTEFLAEFKKQKKQSAYYIVGTEAYLIDQVLEIILARFITPESREFDFITFYGDSASGAQILEELQMQPFLAESKLVLIKYFDQLKAAEKNEICEFLKNPNPTSILIITAEKTDARTVAGKLLAEHAVTIQCRSPYSAEDIAIWLRSKLKAGGIEMDNEAVLMFANSIPLDYLIAANEFEKLIIFTHNEKRITAADVMETIGHTKTNKIFDLQNAVGARKLKQSLVILDNMLTHEDPNKIIVFIITMLTRFFTLIWKINALRNSSISDSEILSHYLNEVFFKFRKEHLLFAKRYSLSQLRSSFSYLLQADTDAKSLNVKEEIILHNLVYNLIINTNDE